MTSLISLPCVLYNISAGLSRDTKLFWERSKLTWMFLKGLWPFSFKQLPQTQAFQNNVSIKFLKLDLLTVWTEHGTEIKSGQFEAREPRLPCWPLMVMTVCGCGCRCSTSCTSWHLKTVCTSRRYLCRQETLLPTLPLHYLSAMDSNLIAAGLRVKFWSRKTGIRIIEQRRLSLCNKVVVRLKSSRAKQSWVLTHKPHNHMTQHSRQPVASSKNC